MKLGNGTSEKHETSYWPAGLAFSVGMLLIEPFLERDPPVARLGDLLAARQYLRVCPLAQVAYFLAPLRPAPIAAFAAAGLALLGYGLWAVGARVQWTRFSRGGVVLLAVSLAVLAAEFVCKGFWQIGPLQVRYACLSAAGLGAALAVRNRGYLCAMALAAFCWDSSSAIFWTGLHGPWARLPVPYWGRLTSEVSGPPALVPIAVDATLLVAFTALWISSFDPLRLFRD